MKLLDYILLSLAVVFVIIGIDQTMKGYNANPKYDGYWLIMLAVMCLIGLNYRKFVLKKQSNDIPTDKNTSKSIKNKSKK
jgi:hypothetical protein